MRKEVARKLINTVRGGTPVFAYYPEKSWLASSPFFRRSGESEPKKTASASR